MPAQRRLRGLRLNHRQRLPYRSLQPGDLTLVGPLTRAGDANPTGDATTILNARTTDYPGSFFPDPLAFAHAFPASTPGSSSSLTDTIRYLVTTQSGTLNLTRHGTQRLNLNTVVPQMDPNTVTASNVIYDQIQEIVQSLKFHLPYLGQRFYRLTTDQKPATLNANAQVPGSPKTDPSLTSGAATPDYSDIYYYKIAANIRDYIDTDTQPTLIDPGGTVHPTGKPVSALNGGGSTTNEIWAQGKEISPYLQETAVRVRPGITTNGAGDHPYDLFMDYYMEFWNMSDRDIYAKQQSDATLPNLHGASIRVTNQTLWELSPSPYGPVPSDDGNYQLSKLGATDFEIDLTTGVRVNGSSGAVTPDGGGGFQGGDDDRDHQRS